MKTFEPSTEYQPVIGFEIHIQLATKSKMFGQAANNPDQKEPNTGWYSVEGSKVFIII
jgi:Asp-tRNA(Asn)/Glu-tRNA(Gln) amidotransferase B subunit